MRKILITFQMAFRDARANIFHTILSVLGMVIGVAALVGILSLIDGLERYINQQITQTTNLESIIISAVTTEKIDNVIINKDDYAYFDYQHFNSMLKEIGENSQGFMLYRESGYLNSSGTIKRKGTLFSGIIDTWKEDLELVAGRFISEDDLLNKDSVLILNEVIAQQISEDEDLKKLLNTYVSYGEGDYRIIGIVKTPSSELEVYVPITLISNKKIKANPPFCMLVASSIEEVPKTKQNILSWIKENFKGHEDDFKVTTNEFRVKQANQGFMMFRIVMGLIVGISVLVGGIGVMNVLLISVTERTSEIGVRKAVGAKKKDIVLQFLSESVTISALGSGLGLILGILFTMAAVPIIKHFAEVPFEAAFTLNTLLTISIVAVIVGIVFGTYPALKASKLDPVEAIRKE